jgi:hypothetical protein
MIPRGAAPPNPAGVGHRDRDLVHRTVVPLLLAAKSVVTMATIRETKTGTRLAGRNIATTTLDIIETAGTTLTGQRDVRDMTIASLGTKTAIGIGTIEAGAVVATEAARLGQDERRTLAHGMSVLKPLTSTRVLKRALARNGRMLLTEMANC